MSFGKVMIRCMKSFCFMFSEMGVGVVICGIF